MKSSSEIVIFERDSIFQSSAQGPLNGGGFKREGVPIWTCPSFFVLFCPFLSFFVLFCPFLSFFVLFVLFCPFSGIFPICSGMVRRFSRFVLFLFLGLLRAPTRNSPERVRDTIWTFPEKSGKHPGLETPTFSFSQLAFRVVFFPCSWGFPSRNSFLSVFPCVSKDYRASEDTENPCFFGCPFSEKKQGKADQANSFWTDGRPWRVFGNACFSKQKREENGTESKRLRRY